MSERVRSTYLHTEIYTEVRTRTWALGCVVDEKDGRWRLGCR